MLSALDSSGLSHWLLGLGAFLVLTLAAFVLLIVVGYPDPGIYANVVAFAAISGFLVVFYFGMGRGWYRDMLIWLDFDQSLEPQMSTIVPSRRMILLEAIFAAFCVFVNLQVNDAIDLDYSNLMFASIAMFYAIQWLLIVFCIDIVLRQLIVLMRVVQSIRIDLLSAEFYSTLANVLVRHMGLYIFGVCIISLSHIVYTDGALSPGEMLLVMMPWYLPGLIIISLYIIPFNLFRKRMRSKKQQELSSVAAALKGNLEALEHSLLSGESHPSKIDLLFYRDHIQAIREWPFTDRIRALVLFGILPPLTWVIAALIEIMIEGAI